MAIDPRISLAGVVPSNAPALQLFNNALTSATNRGLAQEQAARQAELQPLLVQQQQQAIDQGQLNSELANEDRVIRSLSEFGTQLKPVLQSNDPDKALLMLEARFNDLTAKGLPTDTTLETIQAIQNGDSQGVIQGIDSVQEIAMQRGLIGGPQQSVNQREFNDLVTIVKSDPNGESAEGKAAAIKLGLVAKASSSAQERIATDQDLTTAVANSQSEIASAVEGAKEEVKLTKQLKFKPQITRAVKLAEKKATEQGDVLTDLARAEAGLPGLIEATNNLKELSAVATSTFGGRFFDAIAKESGWGSTKGGNARAKYIAIIDNQVLPLLKQTFGAAMTEGEGLRLSNTLGDPNASPEQKMLQTEAFMDQKLRDIEGLKSQASAENQPSQQEGQLMTDANGNQAMVFPDGTFKEL